MPLQVGAVEGGIAAAAWSPDGGLLIILSAFGQLLMLNQVSHLPMSMHVPSCACFEKRVGSRMDVEDAARDRRGLSACCLQASAQNLQSLHDEAWLDAKSKVDLCYCIHDTDACDGARGTHVGEC